MKLSLQNMIAIKIMLSYDREIKYSDFVKYMKESQKLWA